MAKPVALQLQFGGQDSAGDAASIPDGRARLLENAVLRPRRLALRAPFVYDSLMLINGLANFDDRTNKVYRLIALDGSHKFYEKSATGETWSASLATLSGSRITSFANYRGVTYLMLDNGAGLPSVAVSFDGTTLSTAPFNSAIVALSIVALDERIYLIRPRLTVTPSSSPNSTVHDIAYDWTITGSSANFALTNITAQNVTLASGTVVCRLIPTNAGASACYVQFSDQLIAGQSWVGVVSVGASTSDQYVTWRFEAHGTHATFSTPFTIELVYLNNVKRLQAYNVGDIVTLGGSGNGFRYRCTVAGTTAASPPDTPTYTTTLGATTVDGSATFRNEGTDVAAALEGFIPSASDQGGFTVFTLEARIPASTSGATLTPRLKLFNSFETSLSVLAPIEISMKDGLADGDVRKNNHGQQFTVGDFAYPFYNCETAAVATFDLASIANSDVGLPKSIRGESTYNLTIVPGDPTGACSIGKRLVAWKRKGLWILQETGQNDIVLRLERMFDSVGNLGPLSHDEHKDETFFVAEDDCYRFKVGDDNPTPFCGDGMREEIMDHGSSWVENQSTYKRPILRIDKLRLLVYVYTQKSKLYVFDLRSQQWSVITLPDNAEIDTMLWNQNTGNVYVAFGGRGLARIDYSVTANDTIDDSANTYSVDQVTEFRPLEIEGPPREDVMFQKLHLFYSATADQTGQTFKAEYSFDDGATYPKFVEGTLAQTSGKQFKHLIVDVAQQSSHLTIRTTHSGKAGEASFALAPRGYVTVDARGPETSKQTSLTISSAEL